MGLFWREEDQHGNKDGQRTPKLPCLHPVYIFLPSFLIIFLLLYVSSYATDKTQMQQAVLNFQLLLLFLPGHLILLAQVFYKFERFTYPLTKAEYERVNNRSFDFPWGVGW